MEKVALCAASSRESSSREKASPSFQKENINMQDRLRDEVPCCAIHCTKLSHSFKVKELETSPFTTCCLKQCFVGNAMISINGSTPYNAVYGRVPRLLPDINQLEAPEGAARSAPGLISHTHRLREVSVQAMLDGTASARLGRAMNTRTTMAAQHLGLK